MKKQNVTNRDLMKRLDDLENRTTLMSVIFLLYTVGIALIVGYISTKEIQLLILGIVCYGFGGLLTIRQWFTSRIHHPK